MDILKDPNWLQAIGAIVGIPGALIAFFLLFKRDKEKEQMLQSLADLITKQDGIIDLMSKQLIEFAQQTYELKSQTDELKSQTHLNSIGNSLLSDQVKTLSEYFEFSKDVTTSRIDQVAKVRKASKLPRFIYMTSRFTQTSDQITLMLVNDGNVASFIDVDQHSDYISVTLNTSNSAPNCLANKGEYVNLHIHYIADRGSTIARDFFLRLKFKDSDGNLYSQSVLYQNDNFQITDPVSTK